MERAKEWGKIPKSMENHESPMFGFSIFWKGIKTKPSQLTHFRKFSPPGRFEADLEVFDSPENTEHA